MKNYIILICLTFLSCASNVSPIDRELVPAHEFSRALKSGNIEEFTVIPEYGSATKADESKTNEEFTRARLSDSIKDSKTNIPKGISSAKGGAQTNSEQLNGQPPYPLASMPPSPPPGSSAPYYLGQLTVNPSLWPDEAQGAFLLSDTRAFQPMDIITIVINEDTKGGKKAETDTESKFDILAGISNFFGIETRKWKKNNEFLDPEAMIQAKTNAKFEGEGETKRSGNMKAKISAVIMEVFPNGLMRIEGTKIVSIDSEEEVIVISGLIRPRDVDSDNQVDSSKIANMRIDFFGRGLLTEHNKPGYGARIFEYIWPF